MAALRRPRTRGAEPRKPPASVARDDLPAFRRVTSANAISGAGGAAAGAASAAGAGGADVDLSGNGGSSGEEDESGLPWDTIPGVSQLDDAACPCDRDLAPAKRSSMAIFAGAMELAEDEYNIHGTLLVMPEDVHEHVFAPLVEAVLARAGTLGSVPRGLAVPLWSPYVSLVISWTPDRG